MVSAKILDLNINTNSNINPLLTVTNNQVIYHNDRIDLRNYDSADFIDDDTINESNGT